MLTVHYLNDSRSHRILWMLEEMEVPYEIKVYARDSKTRLAPDALKQIHPLGKSPVVTHDELVLAETGAIVEYLANHYGKDTMIPQDEKSFQQYKYWLHYGEGSLMPLLLMKMLFDKALSSPMPFFIRPIVKIIPERITSLYLGPTLKTHLDFVDAHLGENTWFAGNAVSGADVVMSFPMEGIAKSDSLSGKYANIESYVKRLHLRPAYQRSLDRAGVPYGYGKKM